MLDAVSACAALLSLLCVTVLVLLQLDILKWNLTGTL